MVTLDKNEYILLEFNPTWDDEFKALPYERKPYGDLEQLAKWKMQGFTHANYTGKMSSDQNLVFDWAHHIGDLLGWHDLGYTFYKMETGDILPPHADHFSKYRELFHINSADDVMRCLVFLEDKKSGHMFEIEGNNVSNWTAGGAIAWRGRVEHSALNIGYEPRYTLQITGHA